MINYYWCWKFTGYENKNGNKKEVPSIVYLRDYEINDSEKKLGNLKKKLKC